MALAGAGLAAVDKKAEVAGAAGQQEKLAARVLAAVAGSEARLAKAGCLRKAAITVSQALCHDGNKSEALNGIVDHPLLQAAKELADQGGLRPGPVLRLVLSLFSVMARQPAPRHLNGIANLGEQAIATEGVEVSFVALGISAGDLVPREAGGLRTDLLQDLPRVPRTLVPWVSVFDLPRGGGRLVEPGELDDALGHVGCRRLVAPSSAAAVLGLPVEVAGSEELVLGVGQTRDVSHYEPKSLGSCLPKLPDLTRGLRGVLTDRAQVPD